MRVGHLQQLVNAVAGPSSYGSRDLSINAPRSRSVSRVADQDTAGSSSDSDVLVLDPDWTDEACADCNPPVFFRSRRERQEHEREVHIMLLDVDFRGTEYQVLRQDDGFFCCPGCPRTFLNSQAFALRHLPRCCPRPLRAAELPAGWFAVEAGDPALTAVKQRGKSSPIKLDALRQTYGSAGGAARVVRERSERSASPSGARGEASATYATARPATSSGRQVRMPKRFKPDGFLLTGRHSQSPPPPSPPLVAEDERPSRGANAPQRQAPPPPPLQLPGSADPVQSPPRLPTSFMGATAPNLPSSSAAQPTSPLPSARSQRELSPLFSPLPSPNRPASPPLDAPSSSRIISSPAPSAPPRPPSPPSRQPSLPRFEPVPQAATRRPGWWLPAPPADDDVDPALLALGPTMALPPTFSLAQSIPSCGVSPPAAPALLASSVPPVAAASPGGVAKREKAPTPVDIEMVVDDNDDSSDDCVFIDPSLFALEQSLVRSAPAVADPVVAAPAVVAPAAATTPRVAALAIAAPSVVRAPDDQPVDRSNVRSEERPRSPSSLTLATTKAPPRSVDVRPPARQAPAPARRPNPARFPLASDYPSLEDFLDAALGVVETPATPPRSASAASGKKRKAGANSPSSLFSASSEESDAVTSSSEEEGELSSDSHPRIKDSEIQRPKRTQRPATRIMSPDSCDEVEAATVAQARPVRPAPAAQGTSLNPLQCILCPDRAPFAARAALVQHNVDKHNGPADKPVKPSKTVAAQEPLELRRCDLCAGRVFIHKVARDQHIKAKHKQLHKQLKQPQPAKKVDRPSVTRSGQVWRPADAPAAAGVSIGCTQCPRPQFFTDQIASDRHDYHEHGWGTQLAADRFHRCLDCPAHPEFPSTDDLNDHHARFHPALYRAVVDLGSRILLARCIDPDPSMPNGRILFACPICQVYRHADLERVGKHARRCTRLGE